MVTTEKGYSFFPFAASHSEKLMQPFPLAARRGRVTPGEHAHAGEEFVYVIEGSMKWRVGRVAYTLGSGDSIRGGAVDPHDVAPVSDTVRHIAVFAEPAPPPPQQKGRRS
jgi:mannose-6-phosphate isomerase-like protein (cupin superfamily)